MTAKKYIAYGSNMNIEQMERRCPGARVAGKGWLKDHRLFFAGHDPDDQSRRRHVCLLAFMRTWGGA